MSLINTVRATVLSIANKNNFGYITPNDFNLYAKQAQLDIFEDYFYQYNSQIVKQNARVSGEGYANLVKGIAEVIDSFSSTKGLINTGINLFDLPEDYYLIDKINYYPNITTTGTITAGSTGNILIDSSASFLTYGVTSGQLITNTTGGDTYSGGSSFVVSVDSETQLTISTNDFFNGTFIGSNYSIVTTKGITEVERVSQNKIFYLNSSPLTTPGLSFPAYVLGGANNINSGNTITVYPDTITTAGTLVSQYIRYPKDPNWTYLNIITGGEPSFDETAIDYQDFELPLSDQPNLVNKILQYAGVSIREVALTDFGQSEETQSTQQEG